MKYADGMGSGGVICYIHKDWFRHSAVERRHTHTHRHTQTHRKQDGLISLLYFFFQNKENKLKKEWD
jgi:hypothetical protein